MSRRRAISLALFAAALVAPSSVGIGLLLVAGAVQLGFFAARWTGRHGRRWSGGWWRSRARGHGRANPATIDLGVGIGGRGVRLADDQLAAHALILGASGAGKTTTMATILADRIARGRPVVVIDMKGSPGLAAVLGAQAAASGRRLRAWTIDGTEQWNPLAHGNPTALKDMLISSERFSEPHYRRAAERYLQNALTVLQAASPGQPPRLDDVVAAMEPRRLGALLTRVPQPLAERVGDYLGGLSPDQESAARGIGTRLAVLTESTAGPWLAPRHAAPGIDLRAALAEGGDVVLFSLNSSVYGQLAAQLGALAVQGLTSAAGHRLSQGATTPATIAIDEFSALGADNVLSLLARGREAGATVLLATQELADLERAAPGFRDQTMGIVGTTIAHRQDVHTSATAISQLVGTEWEWEQTHTDRGLFPRAGSVRGSRRLVEKPIVHPNAIKRLAPGQALVVSKLPQPGMEWVTVTAPARRSTRALPPGRPADRGALPPGRPADRGALPPGRPADRGPLPPGRGGDHPAPGVTR